MLCSPSSTLIWDAGNFIVVSLYTVQWAAVRTWVEEMRVPPHQGSCSFLNTSPTCQGYSCSSVSWPPTIRLLPIVLVEPPFKPHWQVVVVVVVVVVVSSMGQLASQYPQGASPHQAMSSLSSVWVAHQGESISPSRVVQAKWGTPMKLKGKTQADP